jgi:hypothetical protein
MLNLNNENVFPLYLGYLESTNRRNNDIYILDTKEYSWITSFDPENYPDIPIE